MKTLPQRVISAVVLLFILLSTIQFGGVTGLTVLAALMLLIGADEYYKMLIRPISKQVSLRILFLSSSALWGYIIFLGPTHVSAWISVLFGTFLSCIIWINRSNSNIDQILQLVLKSVLGFIYCATLPVLALRLLNLNNGYAWFLFLLGIVFLGDICAYFGGLLWGKTKILPAISPSKTIVGALSGLCGSLIAAFGISILHPGLAPQMALIGIALPTAVLAQNGDFFESLLKRSSGVKDSGRLLPGHGGILDRLDGVYLAAPFVYAAATYFSN